MTLRSVFLVFITAVSVYFMYLLYKINADAIHYLLFISVSLLWYTLSFFRFQQSAPHDDSQLENLMSKIYEQEAVINRLTVEREISLMLSSEQDYQSILQKSMEVVLSLLSDFGAVSAVLMKEERGKMVHLKCVGEPLYFPPSEGIAKMFDKSRLTEISEAGSVILATPLSYNKLVVGYFIIKASCDYSSELGLKAIEALKLHISELSRILALVIKSSDLYTESIEDPLTGLATKRFFYSQLRMFMELARRHNEPLSLILIDIDDFKKINDTYGHVAGDIVLKGVAEVMRTGMRKRTDVAYNAYRYGGEEMAVLLPKTALESAVVVAERVRKSVESQRFRITPELSLGCTCSLGVAQLSKSDESEDDFIRRADESLYEAKRSGKNRTIAGKSPAAK